MTFFMMMQSHSTNDSREHYIYVGTSPKCSSFCTTHLTTYYDDVIIFGQLYSVVTILRLLCCGPLRLMKALHLSHIVRVI
jgi:hypothetical protein